jgi:predicted ester cyclase
MGLTLRPSGRHGSWQETHLFRVVDGRVVEHWDVIDFLAMRLQLGLPFPPAA